MSLLWKNSISCSHWEHLLLEVFFAEEMVAMKTVISTVLEHLQTPKEKSEKINSPI